MKKSIMMLLLLTVLATVTFATKYRVNNQLVAAGNLFASWDNAYNTASNGDTIYVEGSPINYGSMSVNKSLTIIGPGYLLGNNPKTLSSGLTANFTTVDIYSTTNVITIMGLTMYRIHIQNSTTVGVGNTTIMRNYIYNPEAPSCIGLVTQVASLNIIQNLIQVPDGKTVMGHKDGGLNGWNVTNMVFQNNIVMKASPTANTSFIINAQSPGFYSSVFANNTIKLTTFEDIPGGGNIFRDNIVELSGATVAPNCNTLQNNYSNKSSWASCISCGTSINFTTGFYTSSSTSLDGQFQVTSTGAKTASTTAGEIGAFGGATPYILSGQTTVPSIYELTVPAVVNSGSGMNIILKTKTN